MNDNFFLFWNGPFSQWYFAEMKIQGMIFNCAEQWMMYNKATLFKDYSTADKIMLETSPREQKLLGRSVRGYDDKVWMLEAFNTVVVGNRAKFIQHDDLKKLLEETGDKIIVEASPYDTRWGIGLGANHPDATNPDKWRGENLLGKAIMEIRKELFGV